jgi:hypothetical protein
MRCVIHVRTVLDCSHSTPMLDKLSAPSSAEPFRIEDLNLPPERPLAPAKLVANAVFSLMPGISPGRSSAAELAP